MTRFDSILSSSKNKAHICMDISNWYNLIRNGRYEHD